MAFSKDSKMSTLIEYRISRFQELVAKGGYYSIMNWNLHILRLSFRNGHGTFKKPTFYEIRNYIEDYAFWS